MKNLRRHPVIPTLLSIFVAVFSPVANSAEPGVVDLRPENDPLQQLKEINRKNEEKVRVRLDPKRIINESNSFLKEKEPEMTAEEYAVYEKVVTILTTRPAFAIKMLETMMQGKETPSPAFQFILGNAYYTTGQMEKAEASYKGALTRYPTFLRAWSNLGILYYTAENYPEAVRCLSKCMALGDREPATSGMLAFSLERKGNTVQAEMAYMQALSGDPSNADWLEGLLRIYIRRKHFDKAEELIKDLIAQHPREPRFWLTYAEILMGQNRKLETIGILETALATGVAGPNELNLLADLYAEHKMVPEAIEVYRRILADTPSLGERKMLTFARMLTSSGNLKQSRQVLDALRSGLSESGRPEFLQAEADLLIAQKSWPQARQKLSELIRLSPMNGQALLSLGRTYAAEEDLAHAALAFEQATQIPAATYRANLELATLELKNRHYEKTVQHLEKALSIEKNDAVVDLLARVKPLAIKTNL